MKKIFKSFVALSVALVAAACSNSDDLVSSNPDANAVEGVPMTITVNSGTQTVSRVHVGEYSKDAPTAKMQWTWENGDVLYAFNKSTRRYVGRVALVSGAGQATGKFESPANEGLKVSDGDNLVFWFLGRDVNVQSGSYAEEAGIVFPKFDDLSKVQGGQLTLDFSVQPSSQWGSREIMSQHATVSVKEVDGVMKATAPDFTMIHRTSFAPAKFFNDNKNKDDDYTGNVVFENYSGGNFCQNVRITGAISNATFDLIDEKIISTTSNNVYIWNNISHGGHSTFEWTVIPGVNTPTFSWRNYWDVYYESKQPTFKVPEGYYVIDTAPKEEVSDYRWQLGCDIADSQPFGATGRATGQAGQEHWISLTGSNLWAVTSAIDPTTPYFLYSENADISSTYFTPLYKAMPYLDVDGSFNQIMYGTKNPGTSWKQMPANRYYAFDYYYNPGYHVRNLMAERAGVELNGLYLPPSFGDWSNLVGQHLCAYAKLADTGEEGLILTDVCMVPEDKLDYWAARLGTSQKEKIMRNAASHITWKDDLGKATTSYTFGDDRVITDITSTTLKKEHIAFLPVSKDGTEYGNPDWAGLGVYHCSSKGPHGEPLAFVFGRGVLEIRTFDINYRAFMRLLVTKEEADPWRP